MKVWVTSDLHFWHTNIIRYSPKYRSKFASTEAMNEGLIAEWNSKVMQDDTIYHLGDFCFGSPEKALAVLKRLNGHKVFINGNHDKNLREALKSIDPDTYTLKDYMEIRHNGRKIILFHYPLITWNGGHHGSLMLHGHCHGSVNHLNESTTRTDVGWDSLGEIITMDEAIRITERKKFMEVDHHK